MIPAPDADAKRPPRANFRLPLDIVIAPARAFDRIAACPEWLIAYGVVVACSLVNLYLEYPAIEHVLSVTKPPPEGVATGSERIASFIVADFLYPLLGILMTAVALTIFAAVRDPSKLARYANFVALAANCAVVVGIGELLAGIGVRLHDPNGFADARALELAVPVTFGGFAAPGDNKQLEFLSHFGIFDLWSNILLAFGYARLTGVTLLTALILAFSLDLVLAFIP